MQIGSSPSAAMLDAYQSGSTKKPSQTHAISFDLMMRNAQMGQATVVTPPSPEEEMAAFKVEIYKELAKINLMNSSAILSNSVHITEDGFKKMKEDPTYREKIMNWLRADARASHGLPFSTHVTTIINGVTATSYSVSDDLYQKDHSTKAMMDKKAKDSFYYADRKAAQRKRNSEYVESERLKREFMQKMMLAKNLNQEVPLQGIDMQLFQQ